MDLCSQLETMSLGKQWGKEKVSLTVPTKYDDGFDVYSTYWRKEGEATTQHNVLLTDAHDLIMSDSEDSTCHVCDEWYDGVLAALTYSIADRRIGLIKQQRRRAIGVRSPAAHPSFHRSIKLSNNRRGLSGRDIHPPIIVRRFSTGSPIMCTMVCPSSNVNNTN